MSSSKSNQEEEKKKEERPEDGSLEVKPKHPPTHLRDFDEEHFGAPERHAELFEQPEQHYRQPDPFNGPSSQLGFVDRDPFAAANPHRYLESS